MDEKWGEISHHRHIKNLPVIFTTLSANSADDKLIFFSYISQKTGFEILSKLSS